MPPDTPYVKVFGGAANVARGAAARTVRLARDVSRRADIKRRLLGIRNRACVGWKDRADVTGNEMNRLQKRLCRSSDGSSWRRSSGRYDGYDNMYEQYDAEDDDEDVDVEEDGREEREAEMLAAKIADARVDVEERTSLQHKKQQQRQQEQQQEKQREKEKQKKATSNAEHYSGEEEGQLGDRNKEIDPETAAKIA